VFLGITGVYWRLFLEMAFTLFHVDMRLAVHVGIRENIRRRCTWIVKSMEISLDRCGWIRKAEKRTAGLVFERFFTRGS